MGGGAFSGLWVSNLIVRMKRCYLILAQTPPTWPINFPRRSGFTQQHHLELSSVGFWLNSLMVTQLIMYSHKLSQSRTLSIIAIYPALNRPPLQTPELLNDMFSLPIKH